MTSKKDKIRVEIVLTESDKDIIDMMNASGMPRATFFKRLARDYKKLKYDIFADMEDIISQAVSEAMSKGNVVTTSYTPIKEKELPKIGFGARKL